MPDRQGNKVTVTDWASQCRRAEAHDLADTAYTGVVLVENRMAPIVYEFSNGRRFRDGLGPYAPAAAPLVDGHG